MAKGDGKQKAPRGGRQHRSGPRDGFPVKVGRDFYPPPDYRFPNVGVDKMSPVCKGYPRKQGFAFTGKIHGVTFEFEGPGAEPSLEEHHEQALRME